MREIKFRAWHKDERLMCDVDTLNINDGAFLIGVKPEEDYLVDGGKTWVIAPENGRYCGIDEIELMQFAGLKDSSGVDIYEGDIVRVTMVGGFEDFIIKYSGDKARFALIDEFGGDGWGFDDSNEYLIIGNIHENKDLLT